MVAPSMEEGSTTTANGLPSNRRLAKTSSCRKRYGRDMAPPIKRIATTSHCRSLLTSRRAGRTSRPARKLRARGPVARSEAATQEQVEVGYVQGADAGARVVMAVAGIEPVVARTDAVEGGPLAIAEDVLQQVDMRIPQADAVPGALPQQRADAVQLRRHEAGAAGTVQPALEDQQIAGFRIGIERDVRQVASAELAGQFQVGVRAGGRIVVGQRLALLAALRAPGEELVQRLAPVHADAAAAADREYVVATGHERQQIVPAPDAFLVDREHHVPGGIDELHRHRGAAGGGDVRIRGGRIDGQRRVELARAVTGAKRAHGVVGAGVAAGGEHRLSLDRKSVV